MSPYYEAVSIVNIRSMVLSEEPIFRDVVIKNELGLHARSAAKIAKLAQASKAHVWIEKGAEKTGEAVGKVGKAGWGAVKGLGKGLKKGVSKKEEDK